VSHTAAYLATDYHVEHPDGAFVLRVGARSRHLDCLLTRHGHRTWAFTTAWNPASAIVPPEQNRARQADLEAEVARRGWVAFNGRGHGVGWAAEASLLLLGVAEAEAVELARTFRQAAIVVGERGEPARLVLIDAGSAPPLG